jgi:hypothetical protein
MWMDPLHQKTMSLLLYTPREQFLLSSLFRSVLRRHPFPALLSGGRAPSYRVPNNRPLSFIIRTQNSCKLFDFFLHYSIILYNNTECFEFFINGHEGG